MRVLALENLYLSVVARFALDGTDAKQPFGFAKPTKQTIGNRIAWVPGDPQGKIGALGPARNPGGNPRSLATLLENFHVYISGSDASAPRDEFAQYKATRLLADAWLRAVYLAAHGTFEITATEWLVANPEMNFGGLIRITGMIQAPVPDELIETAPTDTRGVLTVDLLDVTETLETGPGPVQAAVASTTNLILSGPQPVDAVSVMTGTVVLAKDQSNGSENGLYTVRSGAWTRTADPLISGFFVTVVAGAVNGSAGFKILTSDPIVVGTTPIVFLRVSP
jgi:hypothetical protein